MTITVYSISVTSVGVRFQSVNVCGPEFAILIIFISIYFIFKNKDDGVTTVAVSSQNYSIMNLMLVAFLVTLTLVTVPSLLQN